MSLYRVEYTGPGEKNDYFYVEAKNLEEAARLWYLSGVEMLRGDGEENPKEPDAIRCIHRGWIVR